MENFLIDVTELELSRSNWVAADKLRKWFQENGTLPFEHGYKPFEIVHNKRRYKCDMIGCEGLHCADAITRQRVVISFNALCSIKQIVMIGNVCNDYYNYVMNGEEIPRGYKEIKLGKVTPERFRCAK